MGALLERGSRAVRHGQFDQAERLLREARARGDGAGEAGTVVAQLAELARLRGRTAEWEDWIAESLGASKRSGSLVSARNLVAHGKRLATAGHLAEASDVLARAARAARRHHAIVTAAEATLEQA